jgi:hypothetical protein
MLCNPIFVFSSFQKSEEKNCDGTYLGGCNFASADQIAKLKF